MLANPNLVDLDRGLRTTRPETKRMCVVTRQIQSVDDLIRFVVSPDGRVIPDLKQKLPGRGVWVSATRSTLAEAIQRGLFGRGFKRDLQISPDLTSETESLLIRGVIDAIAMAGKAGHVVTGFTKVEKALKIGEIAALVHARDGAADGIRKLDALARQAAGKTGEFSILTPLTSAELDLALGRLNVIHAALRVGPPIKTVLARCRGLDRFREIPNEIRTN